MYNSFLQALFSLNIFNLDVDEILKCYHSNESYWAVLSCGAVYYAVHDGFAFLSLWIKFYGVTIQMKATEQYFPVMLYKAVLN